MWSKGAVVIIKHGDEAMADAMEKGLDIRYTKGVKDEKTCKTELAALARQEEIAAKIADAQANYGYNWTPPKWANKIIGVFALIVYGVSVFIDKYLRIKE